MGQAQINVRTRACRLRTSIARTKQAALTPNVRGKELIQITIQYTDVQSCLTIYQRILPIGLGLIFVKDYKKK